MASRTSITASYVFATLDASGLPAFRRDLQAFGAARGLRGLVLLATEGLNATVCGEPAMIAAWKELLRGRFGDVAFKDSEAPEPVFRRWSVKIKPEIVGIKDERIRPAGRHRHLSPEQWNAMLVREDVVVVDTRNDYEVAIGRFRGAIDPGIRRFSDFPAAAEAIVPKDKKVMIYCTGGIRCEKAIYALEERGYRDVYQLDGGILAYLEKFPDGAFDGECFVFDHRVAVDGHLRPSARYALCPHCGDPAAVAIECACGAQAKICDACHDAAGRRTCSKRCANERHAVRPG